VKQVGPPYDLQAMPAFRIIAEEGHRAPRPTTTERCAHGPLPLLIRVRLNEVFPRLPAWLVEAYWCAECWSMGFRKTCAKLIREAGETRSCLGDLRGVTYERFEDYPSAATAEQLVEEGYDANEYAAFIASVRHGGEQISKVGGYPYAPKWDAEDCLMVADSECADCGKPAHVLIQIADSPDTPVGGGGNLTLQLCTNPKCVASVLEGSYERF
jgi:hypothetical protein